MLLFRKEFDSDNLIMALIQQSSYLVCKVKQS